MARSNNQWDNFTADSGRVIQETTATRHEANYRISGPVVRDRVEYAME